MDPRNGDLTLLQVVPASNPSFLALDPALTRLYSVNENLAGSVSAYSLDLANGTLSFINMVAANGMHTTHLSVHPGGRYLLAANYSVRQLSGVSDRGQRHDRRDDGRFSERRQR